MKDTQPRSPDGLGEPTITLLSSGYWHVRWSGMAWAQWPRGRGVERSDFFQPDWSYSEQRREQADCLAVRSARTEEVK